jgi:hypothetical protein
MPILTYRRNMLGVIKAAMPQDIGPGNPKTDYSDRLLARG